MECRSSPQDNVWVGEDVSEQMSRLLCVHVAVAVSDELDILRIGLVFCFVFRI